MEINGNSTSAAEHILLEGDEPEAGPAENGNRSPQKHFHIVNRSHALQTEMILFDGGWLSVRHHKRSRPGEARMINLRFVDPQPMITRYFANRSLALSALMAVLGLIAAALSWYSILILVTIPAAIVLFTAALAAFGVCAYRTRENVVFVTRHGRAPVIELMGTLGCVRTLRSIVPQLIEGIRSASDAAPDIQKLLRSEMREHYRLRECGVLTQTVCAASTQRILQRFE